TGDLWFTDNGRDNISPDPAVTDDLPSCELNHAPEAGLHFGFPYIHQGDTPDPEFGAGHSPDDYAPPAVNLGPHVAPLGMMFYTGALFPAEYTHQAFIAEHGSWNRREKIGYRLKLVRFDDAGMATGQEVFARGVRNSVGFDWHPQTDVLWFTDNGRDNIGASMVEAGMIPADSAVAVTDRLPECELNRAPEPGLHFGFPYVHEATVLDPEFGEGRDPASYVPPVATLGPHVAPLGMEFYEGAMFPEAYRNQVLIAEHGSWNRSEKIGYRLKLVRLDGEGNATAQEIFAEGWLQGEENWGRPVDLELMPDGSVLVSDDQAGAIYRITYTGE
ncbi:MAG: PQQ-dependent sugar dehydrogenase, partial [Rhodothermales bacterium]|nr:PQQ-dependent sugar dehydrogenase [Rhodothermales bacterium]